MSLRGLHLFLVLFVVVDWLVMLVTGPQPAWAVVFFWLCVFTNIALTAVEIVRPRRK